jgi:hypothetical protein
MSKNLSAVAQTEFDDQVRQAYQKGSMLRDTVTIRRATGDTYKFREMGKGLANQKPSQADVTPMDVAHSQPTATLTNWNAPEYTDIFDAAEVNFDEQQELAETIAMALGRRVDQLIIDAMDSATADASVAEGGTGLSVAKTLEASRILNDAGVPSSERTFAHSAIALQQMLNEDKATSSDYQTVKALVSAELNTGFGFTWKCIESRDEGGLPLATNERTCFAYHKGAVGYAEGLAPRTEVNYVAQKTSWLANGILKAGAVVRATDGFVDVGVDENPA